MRGRHLEAQRERSLRWALVSLLAAACAKPEAPQTACPASFCLYAAPDGGACHSGPALCCVSADGAALAPQCGDGQGRVSSAQEVSGCVDDVTQRGACD